MLEDPHPQTNCTSIINIVHQDLKNPDPPVSNIIELVILDKTHYTNVQNWFSSGSARSLFPAEPTSQEIKNSVNELEKYKSNK